MKPITLSIYKEILNKNVELNRWEIVESFYQSKKFLENHMY
jgi:hypothetical protein